MLNDNWDGILRKNKLVEETLLEDKYSTTLDSYLEILADYRSKIKDKKKLKEFDALYKERVVPQIKEIKKRQFVFSAKDAIEWLTKYTMPYFKKHFGTKETKSKTPIDDKTMKEVLKPVTICDILSEPSPKHLEMLVKSDDGVDYWNQYLQSKKLNPFAYDFLNPPKWIDDLFIYKNALRQWFEVQGGSKKHIVTKIFRMASCKNKAPWASWSGTAWRGLARSMKAVATYKMTDEVSDWGGRLWLVGTTAYKSKYPIQSWTNFQDSSLEFASPHMTAGADVGVVLETKISKNEGFLSHEVTNLNNENFEEFEVIRISNKETIVKAYVKIEEIVAWLYKQFNFDNKKKYPDLSLLINSQSPSFIVECINKLAPVFGHDLAKKLMRPSHPFRKELDLRVQSLLYTKVQYGR